MIWSIIGIIAALCSSIGFIPQIVQGIRTKSLADVSPLMVAITLLSSSLWLFYGIHLKNPIIIFSNVSVVSFTTATFLLRLLFKPEFAQLKRKILSISIRYRIILFLIIFMLLPFILLRLSAYPQMRADLQEAIIRNLDGVAYKQAHIITNWVDEKVRNARVIAHNPIIIKGIEATGEGKDYTEIIQYLETVKNEYGFMGIFISNDEGYVVVATRGGRVGDKALQEDYFHAAIKGDTFVSGIVLSGIPLVNEYGKDELNKPVLFVSTPLKDEYERILGVVVLRIDASKLTDLMLSLKLGKTGEAYLVNQDGYMVTESRFSEYLKEMGFVKERCAFELRVISRETGKLTKGVQQCISGNNGFHAEGYENYRGVTVLGAWRWLPGFHFGVIAEIDRNEGYGAAYSLNYIVTSVLLILIFPFVLAAYFIGKKLSTPIIELTEATRKMVSGNLLQRVKIQRENEIGDLANSFNTMAHSLSKKTEDIAVSERRYREVFHSIKEGVYESEPGVEGVFTWVNQAGAEILGYKSPQEVIGTPVKNIYVNPEDEKELIARLEMEGVLRNFISYCKRKNGDRFISERTCNPVYDMTGKLVRIECVLREISSG
ncbi:MAG: HAMP domain-containing protein [wastewater metagenome]|nr:HAMP domain-containing protein [Candidatus Loosdrechtia aerotolerans]